MCMQQLQHSIAIHAMATRWITLQYFIAIRLEQHTILLQHIIILLNLAYAEAWQHQF
jgi:hypothetical protein